MVASPGPALTLARQSPYLFIISCDCFHLQTPNILLYDTSVGHLTCVFSFLFLNGRPVTWRQPALYLSDEEPASPGTG